jgi:hypothetical protein
MKPQPDTHPRPSSVRSWTALLTLAVTCLCVFPAGAQDAAIDNGMTLGQAEKVAANLHEGMTVDEVQKLLGKPQQTALKSDVGVPNPPTKGALQWSYVWGVAANRAVLRVDFTAQPLEAHEPYQVSSWQWLPR